MLFFGCLAVNYGVLLLQALLEHWPETFSGIGDEGDQELPRADSPGLVTMPRFRSQSHGAFHGFFPYNIIWVLLPRRFGFKMVTKINYGNQRCFPGKQPVDRWKSTHS